MDFFRQIQYHFKQGDILIRLIGLNVGIWVVVTVVNVILRLFNIHFSQYIEYLAVPSALPLVIKRIWTLVTYMFLHKGILHLLFNMLCLYWFGKMFQFAYSQKQLLGLYINGGLLGALVYLISYNVFPFFTQNPLSQIFVKYNTKIALCQILYRKIQSNPASIICSHSGCNLSASGRNISRLYLTPLTTACSI